MTSSAKNSTASGDLANDASHVPSNEELMHGLMSVAKMVKAFSESKLSKHAEFEKLTPPRIGVLFAVHETGTIRMGDLATKLCIAARSATDLVDGLERDGFIVRKADPSDRRALLLELSEPAKENMGKLGEFKRKLMQELFANLDSSERQAFMALLSKIRSGSLSNLVQQELDCSQ